MLIDPLLRKSLMALPRYLHEKTRGLSAEQLLCSPSAGGFCLVEHVCHLRDFEQEGCFGRLCRILLENTPLLTDFEGERLARERNYRAQNIGSALDDFERCREHTLRMLESVSADQLERKAAWDSRFISISQLVEMIAEHDQTHRQEIDDLLGEIERHLESANNQDAVDVADDIVQLESIAHIFTEAFNAGDVDSIMRFYADTYVDVNLRRPLQTKAERRKYYADVIRERGIQIDVRTQEVMVEGSLALIRGTIDVTAPDRSRTELRYLEVARKSADGTWMMIWGMDGPIQEYESASRG